MNGTLKLMWLSAKTGPFNLLHSLVMDRAHITFVFLEVDAHHNVLKMLTAMADACKDPSDQWLDLPAYAGLPSTLEYLREILDKKKTSGAWAG